MTDLVFTPAGPWVDAAATADQYGNTYTYDLAANTMRPDEAAIIGDDVDNLITADASNGGAHLSSTGIVAGMDYAAFVAALCAQTTAIQALAACLISGDAPNSIAQGTDGLLFGASGESNLTTSLVLDDAAPEEGDVVTYTLTVCNTGPDDSTGVVSSFVLGAGLTFLASTPSLGGYVSGTGAWTVGDIANGACETLQVTATVDAGTAGNVIVGTATAATSDQLDPDTVGDTLTQSLTVTAELYPIGSTFATNVSYALFDTEVATSFQSFTVLSYNTGNGEATVTGFVNANATGSSGGGVVGSWALPVLTSSPPIGSQWSHASFLTGSGNVLHTLTRFT